MITPYPIHVIAPGCKVYYNGVGVYIGTVVSRMVFVISRPYATYSLVFGRSCREYYQILTKYFLSTAFAGAVTYMLTYNLLASVTIVKFIAAVVIVGIVPNLIFLAMYFRSHVFKDVIHRADLLRSQRR